MAKSTVRQISGEGILTGVSVGRSGLVIEFQGGVQFPYGTLDDLVKMMNHYVLITLYREEDEPEDAEMPLEE